MRQTLRKQVERESPAERPTPAWSENIARKAWVAVAGLLALGATMIFISEYPSMRREWRIMRM